MFCFHLHLLSPSLLTVCVCVCVCVCVQVSYSLAERVEECVRSLKTYVDAISASESSATVSEKTHAHTHTHTHTHTHFKLQIKPLALSPQGVFRRASDSSVTSSSSPSAHRGRAAHIMTDPTLNAANIAKKIGKGIYITCTCAHYAMYVFKSHVYMQMIIGINPFNH